MIKRNIIQGLLIFASLSLMITLSWFKEGLIYGGGDVGLPTYDPTRIFEISNFIWWEAAAPGALIPNSTVSAPLAFMLSILQKIGFSPLLIQASTFFILLFLMGFGMFVFCRYLFDGQKQYYAFLAGFFYMINPYMMIQVWHRFVHTTFFLAAFLPFLILFWMLWIKQGKLQYLLLFLFVSFLAVYSFGTIAYIVSFWLFISLISISSALFPFRVNSLIKSMSLLLVGLVCWILINIWWLMPTFTVGPALFSKQHSNEESVVTLINISRQAILPYTLQMVNPFYLFAQQEFGSFYLSALVRLVPWIFTGIILIGVISGLKQKKIVKWSIIFLIILFLAKGASAPFGSAFIWGFKNFFPLGVLRNPFEKIGILLPFIGTILFIVGTKSIVDNLRKKTGNNGVLVFILLIISSIVIFHWPMWTGHLFGNVDKAAFVKVPGSYKRTDDWIRNDYALFSNNKLGKILHLPLTVSEAISYNWDFAYSGVEPSALFFTSLPSISRGFNIKYVDSSLQALSQSLTDSSISSEVQLNIIRLFNIRYMVLHKDVLWKESGVDDPEKLEKELNLLDFLSKSYQEDNLVVYKVNEQYLKDRIFIANNIDLIIGNNFNNPITSYLFRKNTDSVSILDNSFDRSLDNQSLVLVSPQENYIYKAVPDSLADNLINQIIADESLLQSWLEPLDRVKVVLKQNGEHPAEELNSLIIKSTKDIFALVKNNQTNEYAQDLRKVFASFSESRLLNYIKREDISTIFQIQLRILKSVSEQTGSPVVAGLYKGLNEEMNRNNLLPEYPGTVNSSMEERRVFVFNIPLDGEYNIVLYSPDAGEKAEGQEFYVNGTKEKIATEKLETGLSIYHKNFIQGRYEIQLPISLSKNSFQTDDVIMLRRGQGISGNADSSLEFTRKSPVYYRGKLSIDQPAFLVFSETFNPGWKLILTNSTEKTEQVHYLTNLYGNGWLIKKPGSYEFVIEFGPQKWVKIGIIIAVVTYLGVVCVTLWQRKKC